MPTYNVRTTQTVRLFSRPSAESDLFATIPEGRFVDILEILDGWLLIQDRVDRQSRGYVEWEAIQPKEPPPNEDTVQLTDFTVVDEASATMPTETAPTEKSELVGYDHAEALRVRESLEAPSGQKILNAETDDEKSVARAWNKYGSLLGELAAEYGFDEAAATAVVAVESGGRGFDANRRMIIRFENHLFYREWGKENEDEFEKHFIYDPGQEWKGHMWRPTEDEEWRSFHGDQDSEWAVLNFARTFKGGAAKRATSIGAPQILGSNFSRVGYDNVQDLFDAFSDPVAGEKYQIMGMFTFIENDYRNRGIPALRNEDYDAFAEMYNGSGEAEKYGGLIAERVRLYHQLRGL